MGKITELARRLVNFRTEGIPADALYAEMCTFAGAIMRLENEIRDLKIKDTAQVERLFAVYFGRPK